MPWIMSKYAVNLWIVWTFCLIVTTSSTNKAYSLSLYIQGSVRGIVAGTSNIGLLLLLLIYECLLNFIQLQFCLCLQHYDQTIIFRWKATLKRYCLIFFWYWCFDRSQAIGYFLHFFATSANRFILIHFWPEKFLLEKDIVWQVVPFKIFFQFSPGFV